MPTELHGFVRLVHLIFAMSILGLLTFSSVRNLQINPRAAPNLFDSTVILIIGALLILIGGSIVGTGMSASCLEFPLCEDRPGLITSLTHLTHRILGVVLIVLLLRSSIRFKKVNQDKAMIALMHTITFIMLSQAIVGLLVLEAFNGRFSYHESIRVIHLGLAALTWWGLSAVWAFSWKARRT